MRPRVALPVLIFAAWPGLLSADGKVANARDLLKMGFFQDFEEIDLIELIQNFEARPSVAARREEALENASGVVSILTDEDLRQRGVRTLTEALELIPGIDVTTDALGRPQIAVRGQSPGATGGGSESVLVLLDGHRIDDPWLGGATLLNPALPVSNVKRIEVWRGAGSALFGSGALAGVVDIVTYAPDDFSGIEASVEAGSFGTQRYGVRVGSRLGDLRTFGLVQLQDSAGPRLAIPADALTGRRPSGAPGRSDEGLLSIETNYRAIWRDLSLDLRVGNARSDGYIGLAQALGDNDLSYRQIMARLSYARPRSRLGDFQGSFSFAQNRYQEVLRPLPPGFSTPEATYPDGVVLAQDAGSRRFGLAGVWERGFASHRMVWGLELGRESVADLELRGNYDFATGRPVQDPTRFPGTGAEEGRTLFGVFAQDRWQVSPWAAVAAGLRFDQVGELSSVNPRLTASFSLPSQTWLRLIYGRAFRAPTLAEREVPVPMLLARPDLEAVRADTLEAALSLKRSAFRATLSAYASFLHDVVEPVGRFTPERSRALRNVPGADLRGVELELRRNFGAADAVFASVAIQDVELRRGTGAAPFVPSALGTLGATLFFHRGKLSATPSLAFRSSRPRERGDPRGRLPGYALLGLSLRGNDVYRRLSLSLSLRNLLDEKYADPAVLGGVPGDYPRPGRAVLFQAAYVF